MAVSTVQAIINGQTYNLVYNSETGAYEATVTAPNKSSYNVNSGHYYPVTIKATDDAGNTTTVDDKTSSLGDDLKLRVKEETPPQIQILSPTQDQRTTNNKPTITWNITDDDSGVNPDSIGITINDGAKITSGITKTPITGGYKCTYTPATALPDGENTIKCDADDFDGNTAVQRSVSFDVDTVPPSLSITSPTDNLITNDNTITVAGVTSDATSSPVTLTVKLNSGEEQEVPVGSNGAFSTTLTGVEGTNTITTTATDAAGKTTQIIRTVIVNTSAPVITEITMPDIVTIGAVFKISVRVTD